MTVAVHRELVHRIILEVIEDLAAVRFRKQLRSGAKDDVFGLMLGGTADAAAGAHHAFDEVLLEPSEFQQCQRLLALVSTGAGEKRDVRSVLAHLLHHFDNSGCDTAGSGEFLAVNGSFLIGVFDRLDRNVAGVKKRDHLAVGQCIVRTILNGRIHGLELFGNAGTNKDGDAIRVERFQIAGNGYHRRDGSGLVLFILLRELVVHHGDESRAAGRCHLSAFLLRFDPLDGLVGCGHITAQTNFDHVSEAGFLQGCTDRGHVDVAAELTFSGWGAHRDNALAGLDRPDHVDRVDLGADGAERAVVDAVTAMDAKIIIDDAETVLIVMDRADRAGLAAGTLKMNDRAERAALGTLTAGLTFLRIDMHLSASGGDRSELTGV